MTKRIRENNAKKDFEKREKEKEKRIKINQVNKN